VIRPGSGIRATEAGLLRRADDALRRVWDATPSDARWHWDPEREPEPALRSAIHTTLERLRAPDERELLSAGELGTVVAELQEVYLDLREHRLNVRLQRHEAIREGLERLRSVGSPDRLLNRVTREVCASCGFERGVLSKVDGSEWVLQGAHFATEERWAEEFVSFGATSRPKLAHTMVETEMARRRTPALVTDAAHDARTYKPFVDLSRTRDYVAAPIMPRGKVIGFFHADYHFSERPVDELDRETLGAFAEGFSQVFERAVLLDRLREQRDRVQEVVSSTEAVIGELSDREIWHDHAEHDSLRGVTTALADDGRTPWMLTHRETEVLALMAAGATNAVIAKELFIAQGTVKSHVKRILRKLQATNRAEAVSRFLTYTLQQGPARG
jgi:DNA-binding CsgD family transcriptional regulator